MAKEKLITPRQHKAMLCLLRGMTARDTARKLGIGERTIARWKRDPAFQAAYDKHRQEVFDDNVAQLAEMTNMAVERLREILSGEVQGDHATLRAIEICLREARLTEEVAIRQMIRELKDEVARRQ